MAGSRAASLVSVPNPDGGDRRATLLNNAVRIHYEETQNDFFYVLDHDDLIFSHAVATLAGPLVGRDVAVAFGKVLGPATCPCMATTSSTGWMTSSAHRTGT